MIGQTSACMVNPLQQTSQPAWSNHDIATNPVTQSSCEDCKCSMMILITNDTDQWPSLLCIPPDQSMCDITGSEGRGGIFGRTMRKEKTVQGSLRRGNHVFTCNESSQNLGRRKDIRLANPLVVSCNRTPDLLFLVLGTCQEQTIWRLDWLSKDR